MLQKMYLIPADRFPAETATKRSEIVSAKPSTKKKNRVSSRPHNITKKKKHVSARPHNITEINNTTTKKLGQHPHNEWIKMRTKIREADLRRKGRTKQVADFVKEIWPTSSSGEGGPEVSPGASSQIADDEVKYVGTVTDAPFGGPYLDPQYGIRKEGDTYMIGDSDVTMYDDGDFSIKGREFRGSPGLWDLLSSRNVKPENVTAQDLRSYKRILQLTNAHLTEYRPGASINITRRKKFREIIEPLFKKGSASGRGAWIHF